MRDEIKEIESLLENFDKAEDKQDAFEIAQKLVKKLPAFLQEAKVISDKYDILEDEAYTRMDYDD